jgi:hypothetical protein
MKYPQRTAGSIIGTCVVLCLTAIAQGQGRLVLDVFPSAAGDPAIKAHQDWNAINNALQNAGPGSVVQLAPGTFYLHKTISRRNFDGTLRGAGIDSTTVRTAPGMDFDLTGNPVYTFVNGFTVRDHFMFSFPHEVGGDRRSVTVSDMRLVCDQPATPWSRGMPGSMETNLNAVGPVTVFNELLSRDELVDLDVSFLNVRVEGLEDAGFYAPSGEKYSCSSALATLGVARGKVVATNVHVRNAVAGVSLNGWVGEQSSTTVRKSAFEDVRVGVAVDGADNLFVIDNEFLRSTRVGVFYQNIPQFAPAGFRNTSGLIWNNTFLEGRVFGTILADSVNVGIHNNSFQNYSTVGPGAGGSGLTAAVFIVTSADSTVGNNTFRQIIGSAGPDIRLFLSEFIRVLSNDHRASEQPGWTGDPLNGLCLDGPGAVAVQGGSGNHIAHEQLPAGSTVATMICDQGLNTFVAKAQRQP